MSKSSCERPNGPDNIRPLPLASVNASVGECDVDSMAGNHDNINANVAAYSSPEFDSLYLSTTDNNG